MFVLSVAVVLLSATSAADAGVASPEGGLQRQLEAMAAQHAGKVSFFAKHLPTGRTVGIDPDRPVSTASVIKVAVMLEAFEQLKSGKRKLQESFAVTKENFVGGSGMLKLMEPGFKVKLSEALALMIAVSDNTATNIVIDAVGLEKVNALLERRGLVSTRLFRKVGKYPKVPDENEKAFGLGKTTAKEAAGMLESVERCDLGDRALCARMLKLLMSQQYRNMIPRFIDTTDEDPAAIASKTGQVNRSRNDVGLIYTTEGPIVVSAFTNENKDKRWSCENDAETLIGRMAKAVVDAWAPGGLREEGPPQLQADAGIR